MSAVAPGDSPVQPTTDAATPASPRVSVVVPIYNVERYLRECLESLAHQTMKDLEVIMVDDGSTDSSAAVAEDYAASDARFRLVRQANGGLGHARNTGAGHARGRYLAFVDSDDIVTERAYELMTATLDQTGSDFATGNFHRLTTTGTRQAGMVFTTFNAYRPRTHVSKHPALLNDRTAWNKLFRRDFWDSKNFRWPEGVLYEDIPVTLPAHVLASAVDVIREPVYLWRARSGDSASITQRRVEPRAIDDRFAAVDGVSRFMAERGETTLKALYDKSVAAQDLRYFLQHLDEGDETFHERFLELANDFFDRAAPDVFDDLPAIQRLEWHLVRRRLLPELLDVVRFENSGDFTQTPFVRRARKLYGDYPFRGDPDLDIPDDVYRLAKDELPMPARIEDVWWDGQTLRLSGYAYIAFLPLPAERSSRLRITLEESGHADQVIPLEVRRVRRPDLSAAAPEGISYDWAGWEAAVPVERLRHRGRFRRGNWRLRIEVRAGGITRRKWVSATESGRATRPAILTMGSTRITTTTPAGHFALQVSTQHAEVDRAELDGAVLELGGTLVGRELDPVTSSLEVARTDGTGSDRVPVSADVRGDDDHGIRFLTRIDLQLLTTSTGPEARRTEDAGDGAVRELSLVPDESGARVPIVATAGLAEPGTVNGGSEVVLRTSRTGRVHLIERTVRPEVDEVTWQADGSVLLAGRYDVAPGQDHEIVLQHNQRTVALSIPMTVDGGRFQSRLVPTAIPTAGGQVPLAQGRWQVYARAAGRGAADVVRVKVAPRALPGLPARDPSASAVTVLDVEERSLALDVKIALPPGDRTRIGQRRLQRDVFASALREPLVHQVLVDGYANGRHGADVRPLLDGLHARDPELGVVWTNQDGLSTAPAGATSAPRHGRDWYAALGRSRLVVCTDLLGVPATLGRRADQTMVQVWHGIPAHPAGIDSERTITRLGRSGAERIREQARRWHVVLSAGPAHSALLRSAFGVRESVVETGLPRHDLLADPDRSADRAARTAAVRDALSISAGQRVVLWAPSFRHRQEVAPHRYRLDLRADPIALAQALGDDTVLVVRPHPKVVDTVTLEQLEHVVDGTWWPDVLDLLLVADVLVTDHSSLLFDFALTGRPMVFYRPDGSATAESVPEPYLQPRDLPGRVVEGADELAEAIRAAGEEAGEFAAARHRLLDAWLPIRDGRATERVVETLLAPDRVAELESRSPNALEDM